MSQMLVQMQEAQQASEARQVEMYRKIEAAESRAKAAEEHLFPSSSLHRIIDSKLLDKLDSFDGRKLN